MNHTENFLSRNFERNYAVKYLLNCCNRPEKWNSREKL